MKGIPTRDGDLHLAKHKVENVQKLVDEQEWKVKHTPQKNISLLSMIGTMNFVVFFFSFGVVVAAFAVAVGTVGHGL